LSEVSLPKGALALWLASDGHGGLWTPQVSPGSSDFLYHLSGGHWVKVTLPAKPGFLTTLWDLVFIPGSTSVLAAGSIFNTKTSGQEDGVLRDGP
jgi:hypothetical protein